MLLYIDNILIYPKMAEDHVAHIKAVFECIAAKNWHVKEEKCVLFLPEAVFLVNVESAEGVKVVADKVNTMSSWLMPYCMRGV